MIYPSHLQIETVAGKCTAVCEFCPIESSPRKEIMSDDFFEMILKQFLPIKKYLKFTTLHGLGEPLLDKNIVNKVKKAKEFDFPSIGFATNATNLTEVISKELINVGLDTVIFSIDGFKKQTHEKIRKNTDYGEIISNVTNFIALRNKTEGAKTKVIVRMIRTDENKDEWEDYKIFWSKNLDSKYGDQVSVFDVHNIGGDGVKGYVDDVRAAILNYSKNNKLICSDLYERMFVYSNGKVGLCCGDEFGWFNLDYVVSTKPEDIYNNDIFIKYRQKMEKGKICELEHCENCSIILSRYKKEYNDV